MKNSRFHFPAPVVKPARFAGLAAGALIVWLASLGWPVPLGDGLDASWSFVLGLARVEQWQFGRDLVFTYGPWGYLTTIYTLPALYWSHCAWDLLFKAGLALGIAACAARLPWWRAVLLFVVSALFLPLFGDASYSFVLAALLWINAESDRPGPTLPAFSGAALGFFALQKFTFFVFTVAGIAGVICVCMARRRRAAAIGIGAGWLAGVIVSWLVAGQSLSHFFLFVRHSAAQAATYPGAMVVDERPAVFRWGVTTMALCAIAVWCAARRHVAWPFLARALLAVLGFGMCFLVWKQSFIRADGHVLGLFLFAAVAGLSLRPLSGVALTAAALAGFAVAEPGLFRVSPDLLRLHVTDSWTQLAAPNDARDKFIAQTESGGATYRLPAIRKVVGDAAIDVFGFEQVAAFWNRFNYRPRPAFQSYQATSAALTELNADYYNSTRAPEFVLARLQSIDGRYPPLDDARALRALIANYEFEMEEQGWLLLRRRAAPAVLPEQAPASLSVAFGQPIALADDTGLVWAKIDLRPSLRGELRSFFYKPRLASLTINDGQTASFRLIASAARGGFLLSPRLTSTDDLRDLLTGEAPPRVHTASIDVASEDQRYFRAEVRVTIQP